MTDSKQLRINPRISIPRSEIRFTFVRSSGPGGQNVNKVASKAVLRWSPAACEALTDGVRNRLISQAGRHINDRGELVLSSQRYRDQAKNIDDCLDKLRLLVATAATIPKKRKRTRVPRATKEARMKQKRVTGEKKRLRRGTGGDD
jgi:ribosome-associated protein